MKAMKQHLYIALILCLLLLPTTTSRAQGITQNKAPEFFTLIPDLPLMPEMIELEEQNLIFDKADGRIIESQALLENGDMKAAQKFYADALPQFGWIAQGHDSYQRGKENITFHYEQDGTALLISLILKSSR